MDLGLPHTFRFLGVLSPRVGLLPAAGDAGSADGDFSATGSVDVTLWLTLLSSFLEPAPGSGREVRSVSTLVCMANNAAVEKTPTPRLTL
jgi:hypothetical protein